MWKPIAFAALPISLTACAAMADNPVSPAPSPAIPAAQDGKSRQEHDQQVRGQAFAAAHCAACHAIMPNASSPNPESPPFEAVVNTRGLTAQTLAGFLRDSHNFPGAMAFEIDSAQIDDLAAYMVTLKRADYRPEI